ncbi:class I SAM-dependent methyltransferase, partial [Streptantibioticus silvisoli]
YPASAAARTAGRTPRTAGAGTARDWAEIQERMLVPLYEAVYARLEIGTGTRLLGVGCGSGLALLMAAARGADVTGVEPDERRLALARERLLPGPRTRPARPRPAPARLVRGGPEAVGGTGRGAAPFNTVTVFGPAGADVLGAAAALAEPGSPVILAGWGPPERCATTRVLRTAAPSATVSPAAGRDGLEELARRAGLRPDGSGRVACPFAYPDMDSAVRGLVSTGLPDAPDGPADPDVVAKDLTEALHPFRRPDGSVRMDNVFRYLIART